MKIAFDLDDTLIPTNHQFSVGSHSLGFPLNIFFGEELRVGAVELMKNLSKTHEVCVYTTSLRSAFYIKAWFYFWGVKLHQVINNQIHTQRVANSKYSGFSKAPKVFGISVMVDDSLGVKIECEHQNCDSIIVEPTDNLWSIKVQKEIMLIKNAHLGSADDYHHQPKN